MCNETINVSLKTKMHEKFAQVEEQSVRLVWRRIVTFERGDFAFLEAVSSRFRSS